MWNMSREYEGDVVRSLCCDLKSVGSSSGSLLSCCSAISMHLQRVASSQIYRIYDMPYWIHSSFDNISARRHEASRAMFPDILASV